MTTIICDRCGKEVKRNKTYKDLLPSDINSVSIEYLYKTGEVNNSVCFDLCEDCAKSLIEWLGVKDKLVRQLV